ncbi:MAG: glycosyltransferase family 9 protein [Armatimonadota bacterium]|nr:glycosyltransferase family 9 protein [Armatimonadota bacterium]
MPYPQFIAPLNPCNLPVQRCSVSREKASQRILIIKLGAFGDILMATPLLSAIREAYPEAYLTWMVEHVNREAIDANPFVDEVIVWDGGYWTNLMPRRWKKWLNPRRGFGLRWLSSALRFRRELRQKQYDVLISFHPEQWPLLVSGCGCSSAIGIFETKPRPGEKQRDYTHLYQTAYIASDLPPHRTEKYLAPLQAMEIAPPTEKRMALGYTTEDDQAVAVFLSGFYISDGKPLIVIAPKTTSKLRCWPEERYVALGNTLMQEHGCRIVLIGSPKETESVTRIADQMTVRPITAAGTLSFREMAALIGRASLVISGDTAPMHVAAAVGTPYLALFGPTPVAGRAPLSGRGLSLFHPVPCGPCDLDYCVNTGDDYIRCMKLITVEEALVAALQLLRENERAVAPTG